MSISYIPKYKKNVARYKNKELVPRISTDLAEYPEQAGVNLLSPGVLFSIPALHVHLTFEREMVLLAVLPLANGKLVNYDKHVDCALLNFSFLWLAS